MAPMPEINNKFFLNLEQESEEELDGSFEPVFQNEVSIMSKDNSNYVKKLREQIAKIDDLKNMQKNSK